MEIAGLVGSASDLFSTDTEVCSSCFGCPRLKLYGRSVPGPNFSVGRWDFESGIEAGLMAEAR